MKEIDCHRHHWELPTPSTYVYASRAWRVDLNHTLLPLEAPNEKYFLPLVTPMQLGVCPK